MQRMRLGKAFPIYNKISPQTTTQLDPDQNWILGVDADTDIRK